LNPKHVVFQGEVTSVFLPGDAGEFELLAYHVPLVSLLKEGEIIVDWETRIPIKRGMVRFLKEECVILLEEQSPAAGSGKPAAQHTTQA
jgi:F-type H+-transporting ATPase subunit epsilon